MNNKLRVSLIITTYNWPDALRLTLRSVMGQSISPDEIIVADDGSGPETAKTVKDVLGGAALRWGHVWHDDKGIRQSRIKNLAVKFSHSPYLIFIDHDTVLHPDFVSDHLSATQAGVFLQGKRVLLSERYTRWVFHDGFFKPPAPWISNLGNRKNLIRFPHLGRLLARPKRFQTSLRGCNLSMFKMDFLKVDGFDEVFDQSWGREDSDICYRLFHSGLCIKNLLFSALQYHLYHHRINRWERDRLNKEIQRNLREKRVRAIKGFSRLSSEGKIIAASHDFSRVPCPQTV